MIDLELENEIINNISSKWRPRWISIPNSWKIYLLQRWDDCDSLKESYYRIKNHLNEIPKCPICGKNCEFKEHYYMSTCGNKSCSNKIREINSKKSKLEKYGDEYYSNIEQRKKTFIKKYGVDNPLKLKTIQEKCKNNRDYKKIQEKIKKTCLEKYGCTNVFADENIKEKIKNQKLERYGNPYWTNQEKIEKTKLERYGDPHFTNHPKSEETKMKRYGSKNYNNQEKLRKTFLNKYGVDHNWKIKEIHNKCWAGDSIEKRKKTYLKHFNVDWISKSDEWKKMIIDIKKKNHTINSSKEEDKAYEMLKEKYPDVQRQFHSKWYPFNCDFYIPALDLYIECQFGQFHHHRPYIGNETDLKEIEDLRRRSDHIKEKTGRRRTRYDSEIETWMVRDVKKREIAKKNNLNYLEIWSLDNLKDWISSV